MKDTSEKMDKKNWRKGILPALSFSSLKPKQARETRETHEN